MRTALTMLGLAVAIAVSWCGYSAAQTENPYGGPGTLKFELNGALTPTLRGSVNLIAGTADLVGPCGNGVRDGSACSPSDQHQLHLLPTDLAKLRSLAVEVSRKGLLNTRCIEDQRKDAELADMRQKEKAEKTQADWTKSHPGEKAPSVAAFTPTMMPPPDPYFASLGVDGVGSVEATSEVENQKSDSRCMTPAAQALWNMVLNPQAQTWPAR
jgi:hypothetical protein